MAESLTSALAKEVRLGGDQGKMFRLGVVTSVSPFTTPPLVYVDGRPMRCLGNIQEFSIGQTVTWCFEGATPWVLGPLANGQDTGWASSMTTHRDGGFIGTTVGPSASIDINLYPTGNQLWARVQGGAVQIVTLGMRFSGGSGAQAVNISPIQDLSAYPTSWEHRATATDSYFTWTGQFYQDFSAGGDSTWQPRIRCQNSSGTPSLTVGYLHVTTIFAAYSFRNMAI